MVHDCTDDMASRILHGHDVEIDDETLRWRKRGAPRNGEMTRHRRSTPAQRARIIMKCLYCEKLAVQANAPCFKNESRSAAHEVVNSRFARSRARRGE